MSELIAVRDFKMGPLTVKRGDVLRGESFHVYQSMRPSVQRGMMKTYVLPASDVPDSIRAGQQSIAQPENAHEERSFARDSISVTTEKRRPGRPKGAKNKPKGD